MVSESMVSEERTPRWKTRSFEEPEKTTVPFRVLLRLSLHPSGTWIVCCTVYTPGKRSIETLRPADWRQRELMLSWRERKSLAPTSLTIGFALSGTVIRQASTFVSPCQNPCCFAAVATLLKFVPEKSALTLITASEAAAEDKVSREI